MFDQVAEAIKRQDYQTANQLLTELKQQEPDNPWLQFYQGQIYEGIGQLDDAEQVYRDLLRHAGLIQVIYQTRQAIERLEAREKTKREEELAFSKNTPGSDLLGVLVLQPMTTEMKKIAALEFANIIQSDQYTAILQLPTRYWRLYRSGTMGELNYYVAAFQKISIPCFCHPITEINEINVYQVNYFDSIAPEATVYCQSKQKQKGKITFDWSEVKSQVQGLIPIFEQCVDRDIRHQLERKTKILDYSRVCDLHLPERKTILRLCDQHYQFNQGITFSPQPEFTHSVGQTIRENWNKLNHFLSQRLPEISISSDFTPFAETAIDFPIMLEKIKPHVDIFRREETPWDAAFQLYSGLVFLNHCH